MVERWLNNGRNGYGGMVCFADRGCHIRNCRQDPVRNIDVASLRDAREVLTVGHRTALRLYGVIKIKPLRGFFFALHWSLYASSRRLYGKCPAQNIDVCCLSNTALRNAVRCFFVPFRGIVSTMQIILKGAVSAYGMPWPRCAISTLLQRSFAVISSIAYRRNNGEITKK